MTAEVIPIKRAKKKEESKRFRKFEDSKGNVWPRYFVEKSSGIIYYRKTFKKLGIPPLFGSTGHTTIGRAKTEAEALLQRWLNEHQGVDDSSVYIRRKDRTFRDVGEEFLEKVTPEHRPKTQKNHRAVINEMIRYWGDRDLNHLDDDALKALVAKLRKQKKRKTFEDYSRFAGMIMRYAYQRKYVTHQIKFTNPDRSIRKKIENKLKLHEELTPGEREILELRTARILTRAERDALWKVMNETLRDQFVLSLECMMRLREVLHLEWDRVNLETGEITLRALDVKTGSKTGRGRKFIMTANALQRLRARRKWMDTRVYAKSPFVFPARGSMWMQKPMDQNKTSWINSKRRAGIKGRFTWHWLRHTGLTHAILGDPELPREKREKMRKDPKIVGLYAGVSERVIREVYLHVDAEATREVSEDVAIAL
jgi:integrase